jgi:diguanylate cyclase (GGDEF)-like protein
VSGFIITQNGAYVGMGTGHDLLNEVTRRKEAYLYYLAHFDQLTGLPNRLLFGDRLDKACQNARRKASKVALFFIDLDRFKFVNDALGHTVGDLLLKTVARELLGCVRESDTVARLGGDEFTVILENIHDRSEATVVAERIVARLVHPFSILDNTLRMTASIGIAVFPDHDQHAGGLLKKADLAMYQAKRGGRDGYQFYVEALGVTTSERLSLEAALQTALERGELSLFYQPQISLMAGNVIGVEALLRWQHPLLGSIPPGRFIPIAEESGLIVPHRRMGLARGVSPAVRMARIRLAGDQGRRECFVGAALS